MENFILCDNEGLQTGIDLSLKPGEMVIYNWVDGKRVILARKVDGGGWRFEGKTHKAVVTEANHRFDRETGHKTLVTCVFEANCAFSPIMHPVVTVLTDLPVGEPETVELGVANTESESSLMRIVSGFNKLPDGKWKITATRVG